MATFIVERGPCEETTEFSGSSKEDMAYAKTFWQSVQLLPPMESRLVSSDIKQRLKRAPPSGHSTTETHLSQAAESQKTEKFLSEANEELRAERLMVMQEFARRREEDKDRLQKFRESRIKKEKIVSQPRSAPQAARKDAVSRDSDSDVDESLEAEQSQREIDEFEQKLKNLDGKRDVDSD